MDEEIEDRDFREPQLPRKLRSIIIFLIELLDEENEEKFRSLIQGIIAIALHKNLYCD